MVVIYQAQTYPVNPPKASPVLTLSELWEVMLIKCRHPEIFVAPMSHSEILEERADFIKRRITFKEGMGPPGGNTIETIDLRAPWKADFHMETGNFVNNTISQGKDETDLYLTFYFEWRYPKMEAGSQEAKDTEKQVWDMARKTVQQTIDHAREMKRDGKLKG